MSNNTWKVKLGDADKNWKPEKFPGSVEAIKEGCTCPFTQPWPGGFEFSGDCPIHQLEKVVDGMPCTFNS